MAAEADALLEMNFVRKHMPLNRQRSSISLFMKLLAVYSHSLQVLTVLMLVLPLRMEDGKMKVRLVRDLLLMLANLA